MDKTAASGLVQDSGNVGNNATSAPTKAKWGRKGSQILANKRYPLRSAHSSTRVLRSTSKIKDKTPNEPVKPLRSAHSSARMLRSTSKKKNKAPSEPVINNTAVQPAAKKRKRGRPSKGVSPKNEYDKIRQRVRYILNRMNYEQSLIQAYASEGWKGQRFVPSESLYFTLPFELSVFLLVGTCFCTSQTKINLMDQNLESISQDTVRIKNFDLGFMTKMGEEGVHKKVIVEKIRPEKELQRAKAEILRCKLRIREAFRDMDSLLSEGKLEESLFDSAGEISSEDIFCAICGSKHVTLKNDIILCDGVCDRGFHQKCLNPPLLAEDIPPGDEGWLCPACDCKLDCTDVLNELQGSTLSIHDSWEKVFPESASLANGPKQIGASDLPSDDSEDNDYDPALAQGHMVDENESSAEDGGEGSDSDDSDFITSSEDSEPSKNKISGSSKNKKTVDDLGLPSEDSEDDDFDPAGPDSSEDQKDKTNSDESDFTSDSDDFCAEIAKSCDQDEVSAPSLSDHTDGVQVSAADNQPIADDSSRAFMETELEQDMVLPVSSRRQVERLDYKKLFDEAYGKESSYSTDDEDWSGNSTPPNGNLEDSETDSPAGSLQPAKICSRRAQAGHQNNEHTPQSEQLCDSVSEQRTEVLCSNGSSSTARKKHFGPIINQKLQVHYKKDPYPSRTRKESLAQELGLTFNQVSKWFSSTRHYSRVAAAKKEKHPENCTAENNDRTAADSIHQREPNGWVMEKPTLDTNDNVSEGRMAQNNLGEGNKEHTSSRQDISCEQTVVVTPTVVNQNCNANSREVGSPNGVPGGNQRNGASRNAEDTPFRQDIGCGQTVVVTPVVNKNCTANSSKVSSPKGVPGGNQRSDASRNVGSPKSGSAENKIPGLELIDEARKKAILRELRKRKAGR